MVRVSIDFELKFSNGTYVFNGQGHQISPKSGEGRLIEKILAQQKDTRKENEAQTKRFERITNKDIDGDGKIG